MSQSNLIALYSPAMGHGKSTVRDRLVSHHGFQMAKMAGTLKDMIRVFLGDMGFSKVDVEEMVEGSLKEAPIPGLPGNVTTRHLMQTLGTEWGREKVYKDIWVWIAVRRLSHMVGFGNKVVVDDVRFPNEYDHLFKMGATMVVVERPGVVARNEHSSEGLLNDRPFHYQIDNRGTLAELFAETDLMMNRL